MDVYTKGYEALNEFQRGILTECVVKGSGGISVPLGSGKTIISLVLALVQSLPGERVLIVCAKSLIQSWEAEITKFFGDNLKYEVLRNDRLKCSIDVWKPHPDTQVVITNPTVIGKYYTEYEVAQYFTELRQVPNRYSYLPPLSIKYYMRPSEPFLLHTKGGGYLFSVRWGVLIIDEAQCYTKIDTAWCQGIGAICATHRWALSGTLFNEPVVERILGYYVMLDIPSCERSKPDFKKLISSPAYSGLRSTIVHRDSNTAFVPPLVDHRIVHHGLSEEEAKVYTSIREILKRISIRVNELKKQGDKKNVRLFSSYKLAMITYVRQALVSPLLPLASAAVDCADYKKRNGLAHIMSKTFKDLSLDEWLNDEGSAKSSRIREAVDRINQHPNESILIFSCFRVTLQLLTHYLPKDRKVFTIGSTMSTTARGRVIKEFSESGNGILLITYVIGAEGLNLQAASTVLLLDFWWNSSMTRQAIGRVLRHGQKAKRITVYYFTCGTGIEGGILSKHQSKERMIQELMTGAMTTKIPKLTLDQIVNLITTEDTNKLLRTTVAK